MNFVYFKTWLMEKIGEFGDVKKPALMVNE